MAERYLERSISRAESATQLFSLLKRCMSLNLCHWTSEDRTVSRPSRARAWRYLLYSAVFLGESWGNEGECVKW